MYTATCMAKSTYHFMITTAGNRHMYVRTTAQECTKEPLGYNRSRRDEKKDNPAYHFEYKRFRWPIYAQFLGETLINRVIEYLLPLQSSFSCLGLFGLLLTQPDARTEIWCAQSVRHKCSQHYLVIINQIFWSSLYCPVWWLFLLPGGWCMAAELSIPIWNKLKLIFPLCRYVSYFNCFDYHPVFNLVKLQLRTRWKFANRIEVKHKKWSEWTSEWSIVNSEMVNL